MFILAEHNSIGHHFLTQLRSESLQKDRMRFRRNMERIGEILAYEISKTFPYNNIQTKTSLGISEGKEIAHEIVLSTILRAGLPFHQGFLNYFDHADNAFIGSYRKVYRENGSFEIQTDYMVSPSLDNKVLILADPMLATGRSLVAAHQAILTQGTPIHTHIAAIIASREGIRYLTQNLSDFTLWVGDVDEELDSRYYIVPGLGDAGDLAFGEKI